jgi:hypothetical protein
LESAARAVVSGLMRARFTAPAALRFAKTGGTEANSGCAAGWRARGSEGVSLRIGVKIAKVTNG